MHIKSHTHAYTQIETLILLHRHAGNKDDYINKSEAYQTRKPRTKFYTWNNTINITNCNWIQSIAAVPLVSEVFEFEGYIGGRKIAYNQTNT